MSTTSQGELQGWENLQRLTAEKLLSFSDKYLTKTKDEFCGRTVAANESPIDCKKLNNLKNEVFNALLKKLAINKSDCGLVLGNPTSVKKIASEIFILSKCISEGKLNTEFLTLLFIKQNVNELNNQALVAIHAINKNLEGVLEKVTSLSAENLDLKEQAADMDGSDINPARKRKKFSHLGNNSKSKDVIILEKLNYSPPEPASQVTIADTSSATTSVESEKDLPSTKNGNGNTRDTGKGNFFEKNTHTTYAPNYFTGISNNSSNLKSSFQNKQLQKTVKPDNNKIVNSKIVTYASKVVNTSCNGQARIVHDNKGNDNKVNDGFIVSNGRKKQKKTDILVTGQAVSEIKGLRAKSRPFSYHIGQWDLDTNPEQLKNHISGFAQVIEITELNTNIPRRYFRSFKLTVESFSKDNVLNGRNWPGNVEIKRWWPQKNKPDNTVRNVKVTKGATLKTGNNKFTNIINNNTTKIGTGENSQLFNKFKCSDKNTFNFGINTTKPNNFTFNDLNKTELSKLPAKVAPIVEKTPESVTNKGNDVSDMEQSGLENGEGKDLNTDSVPVN